MNPQIFEHKVSREKLILGLKYGINLKEEVFSRKNIRLSICGVLATPMVSLSFRSLREAVAAMQGAENAIEATRDKFDGRRLDVCLSYVDSGLIVRHVIYAPEEGDHKTIASELRMLEYNASLQRTV